MDMGGNDEWGIILLIAGVFVSMLTSARGLYLTIGANKQATDYKRDMDKRKNLFFDFIQNELMPVLGMSVVAALTQLRETLLHFTDSFDVVTDKFERTFDGCTEKFGKAFEKNIVAVADAANKLGGSIDVVNQNGRIGHFAWFSEQDTPLWVKLRGKSLVVLFGVLQTTLYLSIAV